MNDERYKNYLHDLGLEILDLANQARNRLATERTDYCEGRLFSYYEILDLMKQEALTFEIPLGDIGLEGVKIEDFLK